MEKTINIGGKDVRLTNNISWAMVYRDQFGHDIVTTLTPVLAAALDIVSGLFNGTELENGTINTADILKSIDGDWMIDAVAHLSGVEFVDIINITWAMAKAVDEDIPEPRRWVAQFEEFPVDVVVPEIVMLAAKGMISRKNLTRLSNLRKTIRLTQPLIQTPSSSQDSNED